jgi:hypothetical protein
MSRIKLNIEIDSEIYEAIKKQYEEMSKTLNDKMNVRNIDEYIENILISCAKSSEQMKNIGSKLHDMLEKLGGFADLKDFNMDNLFNPNSKTKKSEKKPEPAKTTNLKN